MPAKHRHQPVNQANTREVSLAHVLIATAEKASTQSKAAEPDQDANACHNHHGVQVVAGGRSAQERPGRAAPRSASTPSQEQGAAKWQQPYHIMME